MCCARVQCWRFYILANDIAKGGPWICQQLRELAIGIRVKETEQDLQPLIFERLSTLVRLTTLDMSFGYRDTGEGLLDNGTTVKPWQQLETEDVEWMIGNWKKLEAIYGGLNRDREVDAQLKELGNHGIITCELT